MASSFCACESRIRCKSAVMRVCVCNSCCWARVESVCGCRRGLLGTRLLGTVVAAAAAVVVMVQVVGDGCTYLWTVLQGVDHGLAEPHGSIAGRRQSGPRQRGLNAVPAVMYVRVDGMRWGGGRGSVAHDMFLFLFLFCFFFLILRIQVQVLALRLFRSSVWLVLLSRRGT